VKIWNLSSIRDAGDSNKEKLNYLENDSKYFVQRMLHPSFVYGASFYPDTAMESDNRLIVATDAGREGELIARLILNEVNWPGWKYEACNSMGACRTISVSQNSNNFLLNANLEPDDVSVKFFYETPGMIYAWFLFYFGALLLIFMAVYASKTKINFRGYETK
jgi:hypothetical protein